MYWKRPHVTRCDWVAKGHHHFVRLQWLTPSLFLLSTFTAVKALGAE